MKISVFGTPEMVHPGDLKGKATIVIDALRMTSVAATALEHGCTGIKPVEGVDEARALALECGAMTGGERMAMPIDGFDFSNSPLEYSPERIKGRKLVMSTSNGTKAIVKAGEASEIYLGALVNISGLAEAVHAKEELAILCAGTLGQFTLEDFLVAGALLDRLEAMGIDMEMDDMALGAKLLYQCGEGDMDMMLSESAHYNRLVELGFFQDLAYCLSEDMVSAVPHRDDEGWFV